MMRLGQMPAAAAEAELVARHDAQHHAEAFTRYTWQGGEHNPFRIGPHSLSIFAALDRGIRRLCRGQSTYVDVRVPFGHGKSTILGRCMPAFIRGALWHMDLDIMLLGCEEGLVEGFSVDTQALMDTPEYRTLFPGVEVDPKRSAKGEWSCRRQRSATRCGAIEHVPMGRRAAVMLVDDWARNREYAENPDNREKVWTAFRNDALSRLRPVHFVIVCATPWHPDGLQFRLQDAADKDPKFPRFEVIQFAARRHPGQNWDLTWPAGARTEADDWEYLFPDFFPPSWYEMQYATRTPYEQGGLLDCVRRQAQGNMASSAWFHKAVAPPGGRIVKSVRYWDTAATANRTSDWTAGARLDRHEDGAVLHSMSRTRTPYAQVTDVILSQARVDGPATEIWIEFEKGSMGLIGPAEMAKPMLADGFTVRLAKRPSGPKHTVWGAMLAAAWAAHGRGPGMPYVDGPNMEHFLANVDAVPTPPDDDDLDAAAGAYNAAYGLVESETAGVGLGLWKAY